MDSEEHKDLGAWIGLQKAFAAVGGSCSAARAQCLKQVRDSHMLDDLGLTWDEFCKDCAGISRPHADSLIRQYDQFGDAYFRLTEIAPISPQRFQQIAGHVDADSIEIDGRKVALTPENAPKSAPPSRPCAASSAVRPRQRGLPPMSSSSRSASTPSPTTSPKRFTPSLPARGTPAFARSFPMPPTSSAPSPASSR
jgi:hypothetical protein